MSLIRITAPHFVAGIVTQNGVVIETAPILHYMMGWGGHRFKTYADRKGWEWEAV